MAITKCGCNSTATTHGSDLLVTIGPTLLVNIGFDSAFKPGPGLPLPIPAITGMLALVDTGATECCIDSLLAVQLSLPIVDKKAVAGVHGSQEVNIHLAQIHVPSLNHTIYGMFAGVHLVAGGQMHRALIGRTFLKSFTMIYKGATGDVTLSN
ncbi:MAG: retroviral-like aspartic protease family protein [Acidobacteriia bacterium]|nr:retroviral-like aspartic protease family protein [Terriglobia bacterium]